jgi:hypothetical protein
VVESDEKFWELSWYEWGVYMQRHHRRSDKEHHRLEIAVYNPLRIIWSTIMNRHRGSKEKAYKHTDLLKLSFDNSKDEDQPVKFNMKGVIQRIGKTFKKVKNEQ